MYAGWEKFSLLCNQELPRHLTPNGAGCGVSDKPATNHCFVSSHQCFEAWGASRGSAIIQLNSAREITALWQQVHLQSTPLPSSSPQAYTGRRTWTHMPQHTPVHKIHTHASKQAPTVAPALFFPSVFYMHKSSPTSLPSLVKHKQHTITRRHRSAHDLGTMQQAGAAPEEVILFLFVRQRKGRGR